MTTNLFVHLEWFTGRQTGGICAERRGASTVAWARRRAAVDEACDDRC
jgi:hypothetical protein